MAVIKLGGCNGSGKTTVARAILDITDAERAEFELVSGKRSAFYYGKFNDVPVRILGKYDNACGGMDTISDKEDRFEMVRGMAARYAKSGLVFFEGLITGKTYGALGELSEMHQKGRSKIPWLYAFMDTPFDICVERVLKRRAAAGNDAPFNPERTMRPTFGSCERLPEKLRDGRLHPHPVHMVSHKAKPETAARQLLNAALEIHYAR